MDFISKTDYYECTPVLVQHLCDQILTLHRRMVNFRSYKNVHNEVEQNFKNELELLYSQLVLALSTATKETIPLKKKISENFGGIKN